jgi:hypothetical protein
MGSFESNFNIHTGQVSFGGALSVGEIDDLEQVTSADGTISFNGSSFSDVGNISMQDLRTTTAEIGVVTADGVNATLLRAVTVYAGAVTATSVNAGDIKCATAEVGVLQAKDIQSATAEIGDVKSPAAEIGELTATNVNTGDIKSATAEMGAVTVSGDCTVVGSLNAGNIVATFQHVRLDARDNSWTWITGKTLKPPIYCTAQIWGPSYLALIPRQEAYVVNVTPTTALIVLVPGGIPEVSLSLLAIGQ